jgi:raffinose/stachyose/melibiose transport system substrate-binding protein
VVAAAVVTALAACSTSGSTANTTGQPTGTISYWYAPATPDAAGVANFLKYNVTPFDAKNPKVNLQAVQKNVNTINSQIQVALAAGKGPDIVTASGISNQITYAKAGVLTDLTTFATQNKWSSTLLPWAYQVSKVGGKVVALPQSYETLMLFYNKTLFKKNGWTPPTTRQQVEDLAQKMEAKGITPFAAGNSDYPAGSEWLVSAFLNDVAGPSKVHDALTGKINWTAPEFANSINLLKSYFDKGWFGGGVKQYFSTSDPEKYSQFASGKAGMYIRCGAGSKPAPQQSASRILLGDCLPRAGDRCTRFASHRSHGWCGVVKPQQGLPRWDSSGDVHGLVELRAALR